MERGNRLSRMNTEFHIFVDFVTRSPDLTAKYIPVLCYPTSQSAPLKPLLWTVCLCPIPIHLYTEALPEI